MIESINVSIVPITDMMNEHIAMWGYVSSLITQNIIVDLSAVNPKHENRCSFNERCGNAQMKQVELYCSQTSESLIVWKL